MRVASGFRILGLPTLASQQGWFSIASPARKTHAGCWKMLRCNFVRRHASQHCNQVMASKHRTKIEQLLGYIFGICLGLLITFLVLYLVERLAAHT